MSKENLWTLSLLESTLDNVALASSRQDLFLGWTRDIMSACLSGLQYCEAGGILYPQHGGSAGKPHNFEIPGNSSYQQGDEKIFQKIVKQRIDDLLRDKELIDIKDGSIDTDISYLLIPVNAGFLRPIGLLWVITANLSLEEARKRIVIAAQIFALSIHSEKSVNALKHLGEKAWIQGDSLKKTAGYIASACKEAISCADVVVWEADSTHKKLRTLACTSEMNVDMHYSEGIAGYAVSNDELIVIDDLLNDDEVRKYAKKGLAHKEVVQELGWKTGMFVPLDIGGEIAGLMGIYGERTYGMNALDRLIALAFAQRLAASYIHIRRLNELSELERKFNNMAPTIQTSMEAMENIHDAMNGLLVAINDIGYIEEQYKDNKKDSTYVHALAARKQIERAQKIAQKIGRSSRSFDSLRLGKCNIRNLLSEIISHAKITADIVIDFTLDCDENIVVYCDKDQIERAITNLVNNSIFFLSDDRKGGRKEIRLQVNSLVDKTEIKVFDNGPGIFQGFIDKIFDYTFTTRSTKGMGFGLAIVKKIVEAHGGSIKVHSDWGHWCEFILYLPTTTKGT